MEEDVQIWASSFGISEDSLSRLKQEGFTTLQLISTLVKKTIPELNLMNLVQRSSVGVAVNYLKGLQRLVQLPGPNGSLVFLSRDLPDSDNNSEGAKKKPNLK